MIYSLPKNGRQYLLQYWYNPSFSLLNTGSDCSECPKPSVMVHRPEYNREKSCSIEVLVTDRPTQGCLNIRSFQYFFAFVRRNAIAISDKERWGIEKTSERTANSRRFSLFQKVSNQPSEQSLSCILKISSKTNSGAHPKSGHPPEGRHPCSGHL